ncbi:DnaB-like helicase C-terminal domain-containing protein [Nocardia sp. A7]|uniref:DnaB-like helicase C-terminal domain-containing protein n=1 Tax=Nocardia sp. A7 TaxID=2789274 RepID=UPI00397CA541
MTNPNNPEALRFLEDWLQPAIEEADTIASRGGISLGIPTGFNELDELTNGLQMGTLTVVGAHPGVGASTLVLDIARSCAVKHGMETLFLTLETQPMSVVKRLLSAEAKIRIADLHSGRMSDDDWTKLARRMSEISEAPLIVDRPTDRDISAIVELITEVAERSETDAARTGLRLVVIDSLQLLTARTDLPYENREREVSEVVRRLKALAHDLEIAVVVTSQLSSNPGPRQLPRLPALADLRDSGTIAHVADTVVLLHRPDAWERDDPRGGEADVIVAKHRQGPTATITVAHQMHLSRFVDMARGAAAG